MRPTIFDACEMIVHQYGTCSDYWQRNVAIIPNYRFREDAQPVINRLEAANWIAMWATRYLSGEDRSPEFAAEAMERVQFFTAPHSWTHREPNRDFILEAIRAAC